MYLEDLDPTEKPKPKAKSSPVSTPKTKTKTASAEAPKSSPVALPNPLTAAVPKATPSPAPGKIKTELLPETFAKTTKPAPAPVAPPDATSAPAQQADTQKSFIQPRATQVNPEPDTIPESTQTLSSFREHNAGQYAPFATQTSRQQAAHSLVTQAKNEGRSYPAGLDPFMIEFDQTFAVLSPNPAIRDLYKTAALTVPTLRKPSPLSFTVTPPAATAPKTTETIVTPETQAEQHPEPTPTPTESTTNTLVLDDAPSVSTVDQGSSRDLSSPLATVMVPETAQTLDATYQNLLNQVAAAYHDGTLSVIHITGYVNTRPAQGDDVRSYTHIQSLGRRGAALVVDYLKQKQVPESAIAYRIIPTSTIALHNPFYTSVSSENTLRLDIGGGRS